LLPAIFATGEREGASGQAVLVAACVSYEVLIRMGLTVGARLVLDQGLHPPTVLGSIVASGASAKVREASADVVANAFGIGACMVPTALMASGYQHATVKDLFQGMAPATGVMAADLAATGLTGVRDWVTSWYAAVPRHYELDPLLDRLGSYWHVSSGGIRIKTRPVMAMAQPTMGALHGLLSEQALDWQRVKRIRVASSRRIELGRIYHPDTVVSARASIPFLVAAALVHPQEFVADAYLLHFLEDDHLTDPDIARLQDVVELEVDPEFDYNLERAEPSGDPAHYMKFEARVTIDLDDGEQVVAYKDMFAAGTGNMSRNDVERKFRAVVAGLIEPARADAIVSNVWRLDEADSVQPLVDSFTGALDGSA
jgi:2-methylcitrate dehydratase PrpD